MQNKLLAVDGISIIQTKSDVTKLLTAIQGISNQMKTYIFI